MANEIKKAAKDVRDTVKEGIHRGNADAEHVTRNQLGDAMTPGEKVDSMGHEVSERAKAGTDHLKRNVRDNT